MELKPFEDTYLLKGVTHNFATGHRSNLRFAIDSLSLSFTNLNVKGPEPFEYLEFAKSDIQQGGTKGAINALGNAKRAIHLTIQNILHAWGLLPAFRDQNFPTQIAVLRELNAFPTRTLEALNRKRNYVEHKFESADFAEVADLVDIAEMFLLIAYPYLRDAVIGAFVGVLDDDKCYEWRVAPNNGNILSYLIADAQFAETDLGRIYYAFGEKKDDEPPNKTIQITRSNQSEWLSYLDLFVYMTKRRATLLEKQVFPGTNYNITSRRVSLAFEFPES